MSYTNLGSGIWSWPPFRRLERSQDDVIGRCAKLLWLALYTTPQAKMQPPGLFSGSVTTMAEECGFPVDETRKYLDRLLDDELVEYDQEHRLLRLTQLPDCQEFPTNGHGIRGWWRRFSNLPACATRDRHVHVLRWILEEWVKQTGKTLSKNHKEAWSETFGMLTSIPALLPPRPRKHVQGNLFTTPSGASPAALSLNDSSIDSKSIQDSVRNSGSNDFNRNSYNDRLTTVKRDQDQEKDQDQVPDLRIPEPGSGASAIGSGPVLQLVPPSRGVDPDDFAEVMHRATEGPRAFPKALTRDQRLALGRAIDAARDVLGGSADLALLGQYIARTVTPQTSDLTLDVVISPGWIAHAMRHAHGWGAREADRVAALQRDVADRTAMLSEARKKLGFEAP